MDELFLLFGKIFGPLGWAGGIILLLALCFLCGVRVIRSGFRGVYFRFGVAVEEVGPGVYWRPFPIYRLTILFCADQIKELPKGLLEVVTKDGVTCRVEGSISYDVLDLKIMVTSVYDADDQLYCEVASDIREWVADHTYGVCVSAELGKKIVPAAMRQVEKWGIRIRRLNITTFTPANPEARTIIYCLDYARRRIEACREMAAATDEISKDHHGFNKSLLLTAMAGVPVSTVVTADHFSAIREELESINQKLRQPKPKEEHPLRQMVAAAVASYLPGGDLISSAISNGKPE